MGNSLNFGWGVDGKKRSKSISTDQPKGRFHKHQKKKQNKGIRRPTNEWRRRINDFSGKRHFRRVILLAMSVFLLKKSGDAS